MDADTKKVLRVAVAIINLGSTGGFIWWLSLETGCSASAAPGGVALSWGGSLAITCGYKNRPPVEISQSLLGGLPGFDGRKPCGQFLQFLGVVCLVAAVPAFLIGYEQLFECAGIV